MREILLAQKEGLDMEYLKGWAERLGIITQLEEEISSLFPEVK